ncbi:MAG TPA: hypothetical protein VHV08_13590 [Pirellulales bacterium]|nr:hypothetical protein [Pirellulales bacterium]
MKDVFHYRVRAAAIALGWVVLWAAGLLTVSWLCYLAVVTKQPSWLLTLWGPGTTWELVQTVWFWAIVIAKVVVWVLALIALWLWLWAKQMSK